MDGVVSNLYRIVSIRYIENDAISSFYYLPTFAYEQECIAIEQFGFTSTVVAR